MYHVEAGGIKLRMVPSEWPSSFLEEVSVLEKRCRDAVYGEFNKGHLVLPDGTPLPSNAVSLSGEDGGEGILQEKIPEKEPLIKEGEPFKTLCRVQTPIVAWRIGTVNRELFRDISVHLTGNLLRLFREGVEAALDKYRKEHDKAPLWRVVRVEPELKRAVAVHGGPFEGMYFSMVGGVEDLRKVN